MTDKDTKDMSASELMRYLHDRNTSCSCSMCTKVLNIVECGEHVCADAYEALADKIDAELAKARRICLDHVASLWAKDNGWPDFREGEDFGAWIDRCALMRPRYDNGDPVDIEDFGDPESDDFAWYTVSDSGDWTIYAPEISPDPIEGDISERVKRPAPEALGADGKPIKVGETVYPIDGEWIGIPLEVSGIESPASVKVYLSAGKSWTTFHADSLTHTPPDTLERLRDDMYRTAEEWREADSVSIPDMNHWADRLAALIERKGGE